MVMYLKRSRGDFSAANAAAFYARNDRLYPVALRTTPPPFVMPSSAPYEAGIKSCMCARCRGISTYALAQSSKEILRCRSG